MKQNNEINILIIGGSGFWSEKNHYPAILKLQEKGLPVKVRLICDIRNPREEANRKYLPEIFRINDPKWINPNETSLNQLGKICKKEKINMVIVSTNPAFHYTYCKWAVKNNLNVLCDKPLVVNFNSASDIKAARKNEKLYQELKSFVLKKQQKNKRYLFCLPLRRRVLTPYVFVAKQLEAVNKNTGEGIRYLNIIVNGGIFKYPIELLGGGSHGYLDGVGSLSHSSYHYIDVLAWYLQVAQGKAKKIKINLTNLIRVHDYLRTKTYQNLRNIVEDESNNFEDELALPEQVLNSELDFTFTLKLLDENNNQVGMAEYTCNHTSFCPREVKYQPGVLEPANYLHGGRMSHVYLDIHQGALQNWQIIKNDVVFEGNNITVIGRQHPYVGKKYIKKVFRDAYDKNTLTPTDLIESFVNYTLGEKLLSKKMNLLSSFNNQDLTNKIFCKFYEKIAEEYYNQTHRRKIHINSIINI
ncbi:MAG: Gfo/Idh/MocA family oxidoreductase [Candidatus Shapirobacteria bacterium]|jgi:hypothetical protein